jgi:hypothetical protein
MAGGRHPAPFLVPQTGQNLPQKHIAIRVHNLTEIRRDICRAKAARTAVDSHLH